MTDASFRFRIATPDDAPALLAIYAPYVENTAISFEYAVPSVEEFRSRIEGVRKSYPYLVAEAADGSLLGYAYTHTFIPRAAYDHCAETTIYLALDARHQGSASVSTAHWRNSHSRRTSITSTPASASHRAKATNT